MAVVEASCDHEVRDELSKTGVCSELSKLNLSLRCTNKLEKADKKIESGERRTEWTLNDLHC